MKETVYTAASKHGDVIGLLGFYVCVNRNTGFQPFVTWSVGSDGSMNHGHYFKDELSAMNDLIDRAQGK